MQNSEGQIREKFTRPSRASFRGFNIIHRAQATERAGLFMSGGGHL